uniref:Uncharacterized protein n=1 Tax=Glossina pallidipes TaxID=7398 RepID=A0A1B0AIB1_GLOPL
MPNMQGPEGATCADKCEDGYGELLTGYGVASALLAKPQVHVIFTSNAGAYELKAFKKSNYFQQKPMHQTKSTAPKAENFYDNVAKKKSRKGGYEQFCNNEILDISDFINDLVEFAKQHAIPCRLYDDVTHWQSLSFTIKEFGSYSYTKKKTYLFMCALFTATGVMEY